MSRPQSEAEYLARLVPASVSATSSRRTVLKGALGAGAALGGAGLLAACGGSSSGGTDATAGASGSAAATGGEVTFGSNASDEIPKKVVQALADGFKAASGTTVKINTQDHNTFQENINNYLQGKPDDVFTWFAGYRMRFFASKGLAGDVSDVWKNLTGFTDGFKSASTGDDGKQYFVPSSYYPWAVFYRKSVWAEKGYAVPKTLDELKTLAGQMQKDKLDPIAFGDKDGWPAMGTFDVLNMRINGYQFHIDLMAHKVAWDDPKVQKVFSTWAELLPFHQADPLGRTWQEAAQAVQNKKAGMYLLGLFVTQEMTANLDDIDFFTFPEIDSTIGADALDAPIDGFMKAAKPKDDARANALLTWLGGKDAGAVYAKTDPTTLIANSEVDTSGYTALQKKSAELVGSAKNIAQFLDRDTRPDFASTVMIPAIQTFLKNPKDVQGLCKSIEGQAKTIFTS
ncbi:ABC transporter substrate-binding protein [Kineosporia sp. A_224]|uniref:ABC transporter substrate-binding protein n=1 Tax=Kineosporia sp. A_224 TaxID=1962180 RepID=UPI000B4AD912|nr:ABC transporter substrate-binding protein [Kineosporia sp. A_224]